MRTSKKLEIAMRCPQPLGRTAVPDPCRLNATDLGGFPTESSSTEITEARLTMFAMKDVNHDYVRRHGSPLSAEDWDTSILYFGASQTGWSQNSTEQQAFAHRGRETTDHLVPPGRKPAQQPAVVASYNDGDTELILPAGRAASGEDKLPSSTHSIGRLEGVEHPFVWRSFPSDRIIRELWRDFPRLNLVEAMDRIKAAEQKLLLEDAGNAKQGYGNLFTVRAIMLALEDDTHNASWAAEQALRLGAAEEYAELARLVVRFCAWKGGAAPASCSVSTLCALEATGSFRAALARSASADVLDLTLAAAIEFSRHKVATAERLARCALKRANRMIAMRVSAASVLAWVLYEQGKLEEAEQLLKSWFPAIRAVGSIDCAVYAHRILARLAARNGDRATAMATLDKGCDLAESRNWPRLLAAMLEERIRLCEPGQEARAAKWLTQLCNLAEAHRSPVRSAKSDIACHQARAKLYCFLTFKTGGSPRAALAHLRHDAWLSQDLHASSWVNLAEAQVLWIGGDHDGSVACVAKTLRTAEATGLRQQLADAGPLLPLIIAHFLRGSGIERDLLAFTICAADTLESRTAPDRDKGRRVDRGGASLTAREQDVLQLIGEGRTNKMIAQTQGVTPETIKTHVKNIFAKLGVERRAQAVVKAQRLGLLAM